MRMRSTTDPLEVDGRIEPVIPAVIRDVELTEPLPYLPAQRDGVRVDRAWLLVRYCTEPLSMVQVDVPSGGLAPDEIGRVIAAQAGPQVLSRLPDGGLADASTLGAIPPAGLSAPADSGFLSGRVRALEHAPPVTVVVCTRDRPGPLRRLLESVLSQSYPRLRVLVVDSAPTNDLASAAVAEVAEARDVEYLRVDLPGLARARNAAARARPGETIAWVDDDVVVDEHWLAEIARCLYEDPGADVICGSVVPAELESRAQVWFEEFGGLVKGRGFTAAEFSPATRDSHNPLFPLPPFGAGANMVTRPGVVERVGFFDPALGAGTPAMGGEDTLFLSQVLMSGGTLVYRPCMLARHYHRRDLTELRRQLVGYGTGLTAAYTALLRRSPGVIPALLATVPRAARELRGRGETRAATIGPDFPAELLKANRRAMLRGPVAYLRGRRSGLVGTG